MRSHAAPGISSLQVARWLAGPLRRLFPPRPIMGGGGLRRSRKILIVRLDEIGDVVLTSPLLREIRRNVPEGWITLVVKPEVLNLVELCPYVDEVLSLDLAGGALLRPATRHWRAVRLALSKLRPRRFDLAILPRWDVDNCHGVFLLHLSGASRRVGYSESVRPGKARLNRGYDDFLTGAVDGPGVEHEVVRNLNLLRSLGGQVSDSRLEIWTSSEDDRRADEMLSPRDPAGPGSVVGLCPGAGAKKRSLPASLLESIVPALLETRGASIVVLGTAGDGRFIEGLPAPAARRVIDLAGRTTLREAAAVLKRCRIAVAADAGLAHVAAAAGTPVVVVSCHPEGGSAESANSPARFRPWSSRAAVLQPREGLDGCREECRAERPHCIQRVEASDVMHSVGTLLGGRAACVSL